MEEEGMEDGELLHMRAERLKDRLTLSVIRIAEAEAEKSSRSISSPVMTAVADLTFKYAEQLGRDLDTFAQHASRKSINIDDVILAAHRNEDVACKLREMAKHFLKSKEQQQDRKRKKGMAKVE